MNIVPNSLLPLQKFVVALALLSAAALIVYGPSLHSPLVFDDEAAITQNPSIVRLWPFVGDAAHPGPLNPPKEMPTSGRPLVNLTLAINYQIGGLDPFGYHVFNLIVHVLTATLLMLTIARILRLEFFQHRFDAAVFPLSLIIGLLWLLHPLQTEAVQYVTQRTEMMMAMFYLATVYASLRYWQNDSHRWAWLSVAFLACLAGTGCKEVIATAPLMVLLLQRAFISGTFTKSLRTSWPLYVALILSWGMLLWLNLHNPRSHSAGFHVAGLRPSAWWLTQTKVFLMYLKLTIWPWPLSIHYATSLLHSIVDAWPFVLATGAIVIVVIILLWKRNAIGFAGAWVLGLLAPTAIVPLLNEVAQERRMYLPLAAIVSICVAGAYVLLRKSTRHAIATVAAAGLCIAVIFSVISAARLNAYRDVINLWQDTIARNPNDAFAQFNAGSYLIRAGRYEQSLPYFQRALEINSDLYSKADVYDDIGRALVGMGKPQEAIAQFQKALELNPDDASAHTNLGIALAHLGQFADAIEQYHDALKLDASLEVTHYNLAIALATSGQTQPAIDEYEQTLRINPDNVFAHNNLGILLARSGRADDALAHFERAVQISPDYADAQRNLRLMLRQMGRSPAAGN
jgi:tetratricopeptide (TPR) repeat protein